jgi:hypothetical protein
MVELELPLEPFRHGEKVTQAHPVPLKGAVRKPVDRVESATSDRGASVQRSGTTARAALPLRGPSGRRTRAGSASGSPPCARRAGQTPSAPWKEVQEKGTDGRSARRRLSREGAPRRDGRRGPLRRPEPCRPTTHFGESFLPSFGIGGGGIAFSLRGIVTENWAGDGWSRLASRLAKLRLRGAEAVVVAEEASRCWTETRARQTIRTKERIMVGPIRRRPRACQDRVELLRRGRRWV